MKNPSLSRKINTKKRGNRLGFWFFTTLVHIFGLYGAYALVYIVCLYYLIFDHQAVLSASYYIKKRFNSPNFFKKYLSIYRLFVSQGKQLIDRYAYTKKKELFDIKLYGYETLRTQIKNSKKGIIFLTAHMGNWQIAMTCLKELKKKIYLLMRPEDNPAVQNSLGINPNHNDIKMISPDQYLGGIIEIMNILADGHIVSIMGDRRYGSNALDVIFLGERAWFPYSAFSIAAAVECPIVVLLSAKVSAHEYIIDVSNVFYPCYKKGENKQKQLRKWLQGYTSILEKYVNQYPYQCFLFHNVWQKRL